MTKLKLTSKPKRSIRVSLEWAIEILGEKNKYTMLHVDKLQVNSVFTTTGYLFDKKAIELVLLVAEHFNKPVAKTVLDKYSTLEEPVQMQLMPVEPVAVEPVAEPVAESVAVEPTETVKCLKCGKDCTTENKAVAHPYSTDIEHVCIDCFHEKQYTKCPSCNEYYEPKDFEGGTCCHCPDIHAGQSKKGTDFIKIHHYEVDKASGTVIFFVNTRCKKKRNKQFTGTLANFDRKTKIYNNLDRSFSKLEKNI